MKAMYSLIMCLTLFGLNAVADTSATEAGIKVKDVNGVEVEISHSAAAQAHQKALEDEKSINLKYKNEDGSISFRSPRVLVNGKLYPICRVVRPDGTYSINDNAYTLMGFCKIKGYGSPLPNIIDSVKITDEKSAEESVTLYGDDKSDEGGHAEKFSRDYDYGFTRCEHYTLLTCK